MNQIKIGKFIAECRKKANLTQMQLAEKLGITDKSVSKWERGVCFPDAMLYEPLCSALGMSINEFFTGHRIKEEDLKRTADENLMQMLKYKLYCLSNKDITFEEFDNALTRISEIVACLKAFDSKEEAVEYLMEQTQSSYELCSSAYDFYIGMFTIQ